MIDEYCMIDEDSSPIFLRWDRNQRQQSLKKKLAAFR